MRTKILLNEWTEIEVKESRAEIKEKIRDQVQVEKMPFCWKDFHFIEVTMKYYWTLKVWLKWIPIPEKPQYIKTDLYFKRILFIYEL